eukprot:m.156550 g.156550  ORF g.156550 m.156550 type:complete len:394 (-) comp31003_c0_seq2:1304-2485(-)
MATSEIDALPESSKGVVDVGWASKTFGFDVQSATFSSDDTLTGGMVGLMSVLTVKGTQLVSSNGPKEQTAVEKTFIVKKGPQPSNNPGLAREACFYNEMGTAPTLQGLIPDCFYAKSDMATGRKILILEDLSRGTVSGQLLGTSHPHTWEKRADVEAKTKTGPGAKAVITSTFEATAQLHANYWMSEAIQDLAWVLGRRNPSDDDKTKWETMTGYSYGLWQKAREGVEGLSWSPEFGAIMDASMDKLSWEDLVESKKKTVFTLVQGDFHPFNVMWVDDHAVLFDWEMVSAGSPGQELGQYMMNIEIELRRDLEREVVTSYHTKLTGCGVRAEECTMDALWQEYVFGGAAKWIWLLPILFDMFEKPKAQWFINQMAAFFKDHGITKDNVAQPRM